MAAPADRPALRRCVPDPTAFAERAWSRRPVLTPAAELPAGFADLLTLDAVDELVSRRGLRTPFLRMAKDGQVVDAARYTGSGGAGAEIADQVVDDRVLALFADGSTMVLQGLHRVWPPLIDFAGQLTADLGHPVQINAYITPPSSRGFSPHYDVHDVFVLQVAGEKRWTVHEPVLEHPLRDQPWTDRREAVAKAALGPPVIDTVLRPGDALYLPRGYLHSAEALGAVSAHLTVGVHPVTRYSVAETLLQLAAAEPALRDSLPLGIDVGDPDQVAAHVRSTAAALAGWLETAAPAAVADRLRDRSWAATRPAPVAPVAQAAAADGIEAATRIQLRPHLQCSWHQAEGRVVLVLPGRRLTMPGATGEALAAVLSGAVLTVGDLPGLDPQDRLVLARRLLREAVVVPALP